MIVLYNWIREFVPVDITPQEMAGVLSRLGFEIASVKPIGGALRGVVSAEVKDKQKHPNADRLSVCLVNDGVQDYSVVCGAPNVQAGQRVALARIGAVLPDGHAIGAAKLRGVDSQGMICSASELGLEDGKSEGILVLDSQTPLGSDIRQLLGLDDTIIEIEVTPNRRDALSVLGVAREISAALNVALKNPEPRARELDLTPGVSFSIANEAPDLCPRYIGRLVRDIKVGPSPAWLSQRLTRCGIRSINNIVDVTNYVMLELGQPMHAFDVAKIKGRKLRVRAALKGETLVTLEGKTADLQDGMLVIADEEKPLALAGIMGGESSGFGPDTTEIILESASFAPGNVRQTSKKLGIFTDSSYRFERGSDWNMVAFASVRAAQLVQELAGGLGYKPVEASPLVYTPITIKLRGDQVRQFLGVEVKESMIADMLRRLGCIINTGTQQHLVTVPTWRLDLTQEADLMEEIARLYGYENIPARFPAIRPTTVPEDNSWAFQRQIANMLLGLGLSEAYNYSLISEKQAAYFAPGLGLGDAPQFVDVMNPLSQEGMILCPSLLPTLLHNALTNFHRQSAGVSLFEVGRVFHKDKDGYHETRRIGIVLGGTLDIGHWRLKARKADFFELSGLIEKLLANLQIQNIQRTACPANGFHPKRSALLTSAGTVLAWMGELHPTLQETLDTREPLAVCELDVTALERLMPRQRSYKPLSVFPTVRRDLSFILPEAVTFEQVQKTLQSSGGPLLESLRLIDLFRGPAIGAAKKSMTWTLVFRHPEKTLTDADVEKVVAKIVKDLAQKCEAALRQ